LVLNAAVLRLAAVGYERMTLEDVATAAGITRAAIYRYFASKQDLARAAILQSSPHVDMVEGYYQEELAASPDGVAFELRAFALACIRSPLDDPEPSLGYYDVGLLAGVDAESAAIFRQRSRYVRGVLTTIVANAVKLGEIIDGADQGKIVDAMSGLIWAMAQGAASAPNARVRSQSPWPPICSFRLPRGWRRSPLRAERRSRPSWFVGPNAVRVDHSGPARPQSARKAATRALGRPMIARSPLTRTGRCIRRGCRTSRSATASGVR
jgi:AcrR family transcriptional regulator